MRRVGWRLAAAFLTALACAQMLGLRAQTRPDGVGRASVRRDVRTVTIPVTLRLPEREPQTELRYLDALEVLEDGERQEILSTRGAGRAPMTLAVLIQDDLVTSASNEIKGIGDFIRRLPPGSRGMIAYLRSRAIPVRQKFMGGLERPGQSLRLPTS